MLKNKIAEILTFFLATMKIQGKNWRGLSVVMTNSIKVLEAK